MSCSTNTLKIFAIICDVLYALLGLSVIGTSIYALCKFEDFTTAAFVSLGLGLIVTLNALLGCIGAIRESSRISRIFTAILVVFIVLQVLCVSFLWVFKSALLINVDRKFDQLWRAHPVPITPEEGSHIAGLERWLECCGNAGPKDYVLPPHSCYNNNDKLSIDGCRVKFVDFISEQWIVFSIFVLALVVIESICAFLAYILSNSILNRWRRSKYYSK